MFHADYCFVRDKEDEKALTVCVGQMSPSKAMFAAMCSVKGPEDAFVLNRLEAFLKDEGVYKIAYRSDQEPSIVALIEAALRNNGKAGAITEAAPEHSAVGESASNGMAEKTVQMFEDQLRTLKAALEAHMGTRLPVDHAVMKWLIQHVASIHNRQTTNSDGQTPYEVRHGRRSRGRTAEFGERLLYYVPKKLRAKLDLRWRVGVFLGTADRSNEAFIGTRSGNVVKSRSLARVVEDSRWDRESIFRVSGTPMQLCPNPAGNQDASWIEEAAEPHTEPFDAEVAAQSEEVPPIPSDEVKQAMDDRNGPWHRRIRITRSDLNKYGFTPGCRRCNDLRSGKALSRENHSEDCRLRIYGDWEANNDPKWRAAERELQIDSTATGVAPQDIELEGIDRLDRPARSSNQPKSKSTARSSSERQVDEDVAIAEGGIDREAYPDDLDDDTMHVDVPTGRGFDPDEREEDVADIFFGDGDDEEVQMTDSLVLAGVDQAEAKMFAAKVTGSIKSETFFEVFGRGSIVEEALKNRRNLNIKGLHAMDLRTVRNDGTAWDFSKKAHRHDARRLQIQLKPDWLIGSPPCTPFSIWNVGINFKRMNPTIVAAMIKEGRVHLNFCASLYRRQIKHGRHFLHEHPASAVSWREPEIEALVASPKVVTVTCDQCQFGLTTKSEDGQTRAPAMKPTRFMTTSQAMADCLDRRCDRSHKHQHLAGGRAAEAAFYPLPLIQAILKGIRATADSEKFNKESAEKRIAYVAAISEPRVLSQRCRPLSFRDQSSPEPMGERCEWTIQTQTSSGDTPMSTLEMFSIQRSFELRWSRS